MRIPTTSRLALRPLMRGLLVAFSLWVSPGPTDGASLIGDTVTWRLENCCGSTFFTASAVVNASATPEFSTILGPTSATSNVGANFLDLLVTGMGFDSLTLLVNWEGLDWVDIPTGRIAEATSEVTASSGILLGGDDQPTFTDHSVRLPVFMDVGRSGFARAWRITLDASTSVPEPSTLMLLGVGLAALGVWRRGA